VSYVIGTGGGSVNFTAMGCNNSTCTSGGGGGGGGTVTSVATGTGLTGGTITGSGTISLITPVTVANGGTGTATPALVAGTNISITGSWPNQTINATGGGTGTVTSVGLSLPAVFTVSGSPVTTSGTLTGAFATGQTANEFLATPNGSTGALGLRTIVAADVPTLNQNTTGTAGGLSGTPSITINALSATTINGAALSGTFSGNPTFSGTPVFSNFPTFPSASPNLFVASPNGSAGAPAPRAIVAADIPTLNQNTTGSAGSVGSALTMNNAGSGASSGTTYNGSAAVTLSYNTLGAAPNPVPLTDMATQSANTVLGALTATTPSALAVPSCSTTSSALTWTSGTGFGCNTISGSGTVNANNGTAGANAYYAAAGGSTAVSADSSVLDNGSGTLTMAGLTLSGSTPAITTTTTNAPITFTPNGTGSIIHPNGAVATPAITFANSNTYGFYSSAASVICLASGSTNAQCFRGSAYALNSAGNIDWTTSSSAAGTIGTSFGAIGTTTNQSLQAATIINITGQCRITSTGIALTSAGSSSLCSFALPNSSATWSWQCQGTYSVTAGTTPGFTLGYTPSQAPSSSQGSAIIWSNTTGTMTAGTVTSTSNTNVTMLAGASVGSTVTNAPWSSNGTILASGTGGTLAITGILTGTGSPAGTAYGTCFIY